MAMIRHKNQKSTSNRRSQQGGMTLIELMIAMVVLAVGIVGSMALVVRAIGGDAWSKQLSNSTVLAQAVTERIMAIPAQTNTILTITDCTNTVSNVSTTPGGSALNSGGEIDYSQAAVANYQMLYTDCDTNGHQATYDVRWNVQAVANSNGNVKLLTVSSQLKNAGTNRMVFAPEATVRTIIGQGT
jgi:prepilin-type N-terminal cleavage/methylation domain-containing protein